MKEIYKTINSYYTGKVSKYGAQPEGVDWNGRESQYIRFRQLAKIIGFDGRFTINDLGCGYGELISFLESFDNQFTYMGYDLSSAMIAEAKMKYPAVSNIEFFTVNDAAEMKLADYTVASGIFNTKRHHDVREWQEYIRYTLRCMDKSSKKGFAYNVLTKYSDPGKMKKELYYADPCYWFDFCKTEFSSNVALLHDYDLFEFSILVRK